MAATKAGPGRFFLISAGEAGKRLTSAPLSTKNLVLVTLSRINMVEWGLPALTGANEGRSTSLGSCRAVGS